MPTYVLSYTGKIREGVDPVAATAKFAKAFKLGENKAKALIESGKQRKLASNLSEDRARKYVDALDRMGLESLVEPPLPGARVDDVDENARTQAPRAKLEPVTPPQTIADTGVDPNAATVVQGIVPIEDPEEAMSSVDTNAATIVAASPVIEAPSGGVDPNAATIVAAPGDMDLAIRASRPENTPSPADPSPEITDEPQEDEVKPGLIARFLAIFKR